MNKKITPYILLFLTALLLFSCKSAKLSDAEEKQRIGEYFEAAAIYRKVYTKTSPQKRDLRGYIAYRMAECNRLINNTPRATSAYMNALRYDYPDSIVSLRLGQMYQKSGKYMDAIRHYNDFLLLNPESQLALNGIKGSELAPQWKQNPSRYIVKRMEKFNSRRGEFCPMLYGEKYDQLYYTSSRTPKGANKDKDETISAITGQRNNDFFLVKQDEQGNWLAPVELEDEVNTEFDEGTPSFSKDGNTMYYTYCAQDPEGPRTSEIYVSTRSSAKWGKGTRASIVKDSVTALGHPAVSPDGKYLYYVSDAVGGFGGKDIFRSRLVGNDFGPMENLGPDINTPGDEMFPYVRDSVTLYFASNGHPGMGGLDLFKATLRPESQKALDEMIKMLNDNPNVTIELGAHTDRKGSDQYNERLAQRRAQSVVDYLIAGGIEKERLEAKGYGESVPKVINKKMAKNYDFLNEGDVLTEEFILTLTPEQQEIADQINRRTEFKVLRTNYNLF